MGLVTMSVVSQMLHGTATFAYMYLKFKPNVGKYSIHGAYG